MRARSHSEVASLSEAWTLLGLAEPAEGEALAAAFRAAVKAAHPSAALLFHWKSLRRQVRVRGAVEPVSEAEADAYFASRARESRIGAWASEQSRPLDSRETLELAVAREAARFADGDVPRPEHWTGWRVVPDSVEFWRDRPFRLHDRLRFDRAGQGWSTTRLWP